MSNDRDNIFTTAKHEIGVTHLLRSIIDSIFIITSCSENLLCPKLKILVYLKDAFQFRLNFKLISSSKMFHILRVT